MKDQIYGTFHKRKDKDHGWTLIKMVHSGAYITDDKWPISPTNCIYQY